MTKTLYAEFTVKEGSEARVAEMMATLAGHVRNESGGNVMFLPYTRETNPREYFVFEVYRDEQAFQEHIGATTVGSSTRNLPNTSKVKDQS